MNFMQPGDMKRCSDEALAVSAQGKNRDAENELVVRALPMVKFLVSAFTSPDKSVGEDDLIQEALLGVLSAIHSFDEKKGVKFMTYASRCAVNRLLSFLKRTSTHSLPVVELENGIQTGSLKDEPESKLVENENYVKFIKSVRDALTETELEVLNRYLKGLSYEQISLETGLTQKAVDNALYRARSKIKAMR